MNPQGSNNIKYHIFMLNVCFLFVLILLHNTPFFRAVRVYWVTSIIRYFPKLYAGPIKTLSPLQALDLEFYFMVKTCFMHNLVDDFLDAWKRNNTKSCKKLFQTIIFELFQHFFIYSIP